MAKPKRILKSFTFVLASQAVDNIEQVQAVDNIEQVNEIIFLLRELK